MYVMYVSMFWYVCMYVRTYVRRYVCMYVCMHVRVRTHVCVCVCVCEGMYGCVLLKHCMISCESHTTYQTYHVH